MYAGASQFERIEKQNGTGTTTQFGESILGMLIRKQGTGTYYTRLPDGSLLSQRTPAGTHYYLEDGLGSITGMTDANGALVAEYRYDPYGWVIYEKNGSPYNPWRFKSGYQSQTTLHYKFGHRWYTPKPAAEPNRPPRTADLTRRLEPLRLRGRGSDQRNRSTGSSASRVSEGTVEWSVASVGCRSAP